jgi:hypothetical protein
MQSAIRTDILVTAGFNPRANLIDHPAAGSFPRERISDNARQARSGTSEFELAHAFLRANFVLMDP